MNSTKSCTEESISKKIKKLQYGSRTIIKGNTITTFKTTQKSNALCCRQHITSARKQILYFGITEKILVAINPQMKSDSKELEIAANSIYASYKKYSSKEKLARIRNWLEKRKRRIYKRCLE